MYTFADNQEQNGFRDAGFPVPSYLDQTMNMYETFHMPLIMEIYAVWYMVDVIIFFPVLAAFLILPTEDFKNLVMTYYGKPLLKFVDPFMHLIFIITGDGEHYMSIEEMES